jgi:hypothetical protein
MAHRRPFWHCALAVFMGGCVAAQDYLEPDPTRGAGMVVADGWPTLPDAMVFG